MSARKKTKSISALRTVSTLIFIFTISLSSANAGPSLSESNTCLREEISTNNFNSLPQYAIAKQLGWVDAPQTFCGGYYLEGPFLYETKVDDKKAIEIIGEQGLLSKFGTSTLEGNVVVNRQGQQITANKAYLYRNITSGKLNALRMVGDVHYREPYTLIIAKEGRYNLENKSKSLLNILYRTSLALDRKLLGPKLLPDELRRERQIRTLTAWGSAYQFSQTEPLVYELIDASYTTCPPIGRTPWQVRAKHIVIDKNKGRGYATHARLLIKNVPILYVPYISFPLDRRRKTGFLIPTFGTSNEWGTYLLTPFYWNMAPNYDMTITPGYLSKRGFQFSDNFRYLTYTSLGNLNGSILPNDRAFAELKRQYKRDYRNSKDPVIQADLNRLLNSNNTRRSFVWRDSSQYNENWSSYIDFNYAGDDYYLRDFGNNLNETLKNQLLQEGDLYYKSRHLQLLTRLQAYQTLHPIDVNNAVPIENQYRRVPQVVLNVDYPDGPYGFEYFLNSEATHFEILKTPGTDLLKPEGNRLHVQPGISWGYYLPFFYVNPRIQLAMTNYNLRQVGNRNNQRPIPANQTRVLPIFDIVSGTMLSRHCSIFGRPYQQTLEPQLYYTYVPYQSQSDIPVFDTTVNTLTYDQLFTYNRFSGIDRIGDANQVSVGMTTRFIDGGTGFEKVRLSIGEIIYFRKRRVTLCNDDKCTDNPNNPYLERSLSPISAMFKYNINPAWNFLANVLWNPISKLFENNTFNFHYGPDERHIINLGYSFVRNGDSLSGITVNSSQSNLQVASFSYAWPLSEKISTLGRISQDIRQNHFQNLLLGLQYDTCCFAIRLVGGRTLTGLSTSNTPQYRNQYFIQISLKGLGNVATGNPTGLLNTISGYKTHWVGNLDDE
jgi:LPS-assembly protein